MDKELQGVIKRFERFEEHVRDRNLQEMLRMIELGHDVNMPKPGIYFSDNPILVSMVDSKTWTLALFLMEHKKQLKLDVNVRTTTGYQWTSLHYAVSAANYKLVDALVENGADLNCESRKQNWTPLQVLFNSNKSYRQPRTIRPEGIFKRQAAVFHRLIIAGADITDAMLYTYSLPRTWSKYLSREINGHKYLQAILHELFGGELLCVLRLVVEFVFSKSIREM